MSDFFFPFFFGLLFGGFVGICIGLSVATNQMQRMATENGAGIFCPVTGDFAWNGQCK
jgi:hypothetical protein